MKPFLKTILLGSMPVFAGIAMGAGPTDTPATQPSTQPAPKILATNDAPLIIPDGTSGPVQQGGQFLNGPVSGFRH